RRDRKIHSAVHDVHHDLKHAGGDVRPTRASDGEQHPFGVLLLEHEGGGHRRDGDPPGRDGVVLAVHEPVDVRGARLRGEIVHLVVEEEPGTAGNQAAPEAVVQGGGEGDGVSGPVEDGDLRGVLQLRGRSGGTQGGRGLERGGGGRAGGV